MDAVLIQLVNRFLQATPHLRTHWAVGTYFKQLGNRGDASLKDECEARSNSGIVAMRWLRRQLDEFSGRDLPATLGNESE